MSEDIEKTQSSSTQTSLNSIGMGSSLNLADSSDTSSSRLTPEGGAPPGETIYDCMGFLIYCLVHKKFALSKADNAVWMPFVVIPHSKTYKISAKDGVCIVLSTGHKELDPLLQKKPPVKSNTSAQLTRIQLPDKKFITQLIQIVKLGASNDFKCCLNTKRLQWVPKNDVMNGNIEKLWGPEVTQIAKMVEQEVKLSIAEFSLETVFKYIDEESVENNSDNNSGKKMLKSLKMERKDLEKIYTDFIEHCFPSFFMCIDSFKYYMADYGYDRSDPRLIRMFNAFSIQGNQFLNFQEFLLGLAAMEPESLHEDFRYEFIYRYYDSDRDLNLTEEEVKMIIKDMFGSKEDDTVLNDKTKDVVTAIASKDNKISCKDFSEAITSEQLKGTDFLCRFSKPFLVEVSKSMTEKTRQRKKARDYSSAFLKTNRKNKGICYGCRGKQFDYGLHSVKFDTNGRCVEPRRIFEPSDSISGDIMTSQRFSMEYKFNSSSFAQVFIDWIRVFNGKKVKVKNFLSDDKELFIKYLTNLCAATKSLFSNEDRVMKLNSPIVIMGDIRANLKDLFSLESVLWLSFPVVSANYLFLGNYIEFGGHGIECIIYLFSLKLIAPNKIFLLRGCHEVKDFQQKNKFQSECIDKYGQEIGLKIWEMINNVFDELPIAAIVDESIFCANGGIPQNNFKIDDINTMSKDLKRPEKYSKIMNEILNNEPLTPDIKVGNISKGFARNDSRKNYFWFDEKAVNNFFETNGLTHIIRSNNLYNSNGFASHFGEKCLTVFSSSNFKDNNELATVFVDSDRIRIVTIESQITNNTNNSDNKTV